jgi:hypothetical protein
MQQLIRPAISLILIVLSVLGLMNVYGDNADVEELAKEIACPGCESSLSRIERTPLSQTFHMVTDKAGTVVVSCQRSGIFIGDYSCKKE